MKHLLLGTAAAVALTVGLSGAANALVIDATIGGWTGVGTNAATKVIAGFGAVTATSIPAGSVITQTTFDGNGADASSVAPPLNGGAVLTASNFDGFGVTDDEITGAAQKITVSWANPLTVTDVYVLDFFSQNPGTGDAGFTEVATITIGGVSQNVNAVSTTPNTTGAQAINLLALGFTAAQLMNITSITFEAPRCSDLSGCTGSQTNDYAVAGIAAVPIPAALPLLLTALGGLGLIARRRKGETV